MKNIFKVLSILLIAVLVLAGCNSEAPTTDEPVVDNVEPCALPLLPKYNQRSGFLSKYFRRHESPQRRYG